MASSLFLDRFVFGTHVYREPSLPPAEIKRDLRTLRDLGFNTVKVQESWCIDNPREGEINLSKVEEVVAEAATLGLGVYLGLTMEQMPMWVWRKYPDCRLVNGLGEPHNDPTQYLLSSDGKPGPCWDHPGVRQEAERFMAALARQLGRYDSIVVWNVWQEIGFWPPRPGATTLAQTSLCYCPRTLARFRHWLEAKYGSLTALNAAWRTAFGQWDEVEPPRMFMMVPSWIDWRYFMDDVYLADVVRWRAAVLQANDPQHRPTMAHVGTPVIGSGAEWRWARGVDVFGMSYYPAWSTVGPWDHGAVAAGVPLDPGLCLRYEMADSSLRFDATRGAAGDKAFWAAEFQGGPVNTGLYRGPTPTPQDIHRWLLLALASGVQGISFWNYRPEIFWSEMHGFGLCEGDGTPTERAREAGRIGQALNRHANLFSSAQQPARSVALVVDESRYHWAQATPDALEHLRHTLKGWYRCLWEAGIWVDFVEAEQVLSGALHAYQAVVLTFPLALSAAMVQALRRYVAEGGTLICEGAAGRVDDLGFANLSGLAPGLEDVFGARHASLSLCGEWGGPRWTPKERHAGEILPSVELMGAGVLAGHRARASLYLETYMPTTGQPVLTSPHGVVGVAHRYGQGQAFLVGTFLGHAIASYDDAGTRALMLALLQSADVAGERCGRLLCRRRVAGEQEAWFLINPTSESVEEEVAISGFATAADLTAGLLEPGQNQSVRVTVAPFAIRCLILTREGAS